MKLNRRKFMGLVAAVPLAGLAAKWPLKGLDKKWGEFGSLYGTRWVTSKDLQGANEYLAIMHPTAERGIIEQAQVDIARDVAVKIDKLIRGSL